jgi:hypothetical protein
MKNRRDFLKLGGMAGIGMAGSGLLSSYAEAIPANLDAILTQSNSKHTQKFNMSGYAAPKIDHVRIGFIGLGNRGGLAVKRIARIGNTSVKALCDIRPEKTQNAVMNLKNTPHNPVVYNSGEDAWKKLCERDDIDLIYICTPWALHTPMAVYAMNQGKHVCVEVPAATTLAECWQLVETSEKTKKHCMMLENCCYDFFEMLTLNMARQGLFGEIIHCEGAYIHDLLEGNFSKTKNQGQWRLKENIKHNGNLYPTHGLGPVCQVMNINRGDRMDFLVSVSGNDFMMNNKAKELAATDESYKPYVNSSFRGNMNTTTIKTHQGRTIMLQHDVTSPRPYSRIHLISGTKGTALKYPLPGRISMGHEEWVSEEVFKTLEEKYTPPLVRKIGEMAKKVGGHGGMDFLMDWRTIDCLRNGLPLDQDVYDAALWSSILPLSEWSVKNRSNSIDVPDFTGGSWAKNLPIDLSLSTGANTRIL